MHTLFFPDLASDRTALTVEGDEARHALRVKRLAVGEHVRILDGKGLVAVARVDGIKGNLSLSIVERAIAPRTTPGVHVWSATPKGPRVAELIESLVQVGAASWTPMSTRLGVVDPRESKLDRLTRVALEAAKQSQRPWLMTIEPKRTFEEALSWVPPVASETSARPSLVLADSSGSRYAPTGAPAIRVLIGPEGGFTAQELERARAAGAQVTSLGPHVLRIETAAPVAAALILNAERT